MDRRSWPWRKKSSEKLSVPVEQGDTTAAAGLVPLAVKPVLSTATPLTKTHEEQDVGRTVRICAPKSDVSVLPFQELEDKVEKLNEKLSATLAESNAKDDLVKQHAKVAEEAVSGWEKAEAEAASLKEQLDTALHQKIVAEDRVSHLDGALKECMGQLRQAQVEHEQKVHEVIMKKANELDRIRTEFEEKLAETSQRLLEASAENTVMRKSLQERTQTIEELKDRKACAEGDVKVLQVRLDSVEKENSALKYELHVLNKELEIRNEERECNKRSADVANKQHVESTKRIAKLETECQRLRALVRKRLPGPAAVAQMRMEVETLERETAEGKKKRLQGLKGTVSGSIVGESLHDSTQEKMVQINVLSERMLALEEETKILKETLDKKNKDLQASRVMCARTANKLSQVEAQLEASYREHGITKTGDPAIDVHVEMSKSINTSKKLSFVSISEDVGNGDEASCAESWASALISELAQFKKDNADTVTNKVFDSSEFNLMDDFVEMERLAALSSQKANDSGTCSGKEDKKLNGPTENQSSSISSLVKRKGPSEETLGTREMSPAAVEQLSSTQSRSSTNEGDLASLQGLLGMVYEAHAKSKDMDEVMEKVKAVIMKAQYSTVEQVGKMKENLNSLQDFSIRGLNSGCLQGIVSDTFSRRSHSQGSTSEEEMDTFSSSYKARPISLELKLNASIHKIMRLIEGFVQSNSVDHVHSKSMPLIASGPQLFGNSSDLPGYTMRVLQWQNSDFDAIIQGLVKVCSDLLHGKANMVEFVEEVASTLDWLVNHFFSLQDVSSMRATIKKRLEWDDDSHSASESEAPGVNSPNYRQEKACDSENIKYVHESFLSTQSIGRSEPTSLITNVSNQLEEAKKLLSEREKIEFLLNEEVSRLKDELICIKKEKEGLEERLRLANMNFDAIKQLLHESEQSISKLQSELSATMELRHSLEDQLATQMSANEQLDCQLKDIGNELNQVQEKMSSVQEELEEQCIYSQELEAKCLDLQGQLQSVGKRETSRDVETAVLLQSADEDEMRLRKEREIAAAAEKLAECQQTIFILGKQLKALTSPTDSLDVSSLSSSDSSRPDKLLSDSSNQHGSLFDDIRGDKSDEIQEHDSSTDMLKTKEVLWPRTDKDNKSRQELVDARHRSPGLLYGSRLLTDGPQNKGAHEDVIEKQSSEGNSHNDVILQSPGRSSGRVLNKKTKGTGTDSSKCVSGGEASSTSPDERGHNHTRSHSHSHGGGGFSRFFYRQRSAH